MINPGQTLENPVTGERFTFTSHRRQHRRRAARLRLRPPSPAACFPPCMSTRSRPSASRSSRAGCAFGSACARGSPAPATWSSRSPRASPTRSPTPATRRPELRVEVRPALQMEEMFAEVIAMAHAGRMNRRGMPRNVLELAFAARTLRPGGARAAAERRRPARPARSARPPRPPRRAPARQRPCGRGSPCMDRLEPGATTRGAVTGNWYGHPHRISSAGEAASMAARANLTSTALDVLRACPMSSTASSGHIGTYPPQGAR